MGRIPVWHALVALFLPARLNAAVNGAIQDVALPVYGIGAHLRITSP